MRNQKILNKQHKYKHFIHWTVIIILVTAFSASLGVWLGHHDAPIKSIVEVEAKSCYILPVGTADTLYFELHPEQAVRTGNGRQHGDTLLTFWHFSCIADSAARTMYIKGVCMGNDAEVIACMHDVGEVLRGKRKTEILRQALKQKRLEVEQMRHHVAELDYYARTHSAIDAGYNEVMGFAEMYRRRLVLADSTLRLLQRAVSDGESAMRHVDFKVNGTRVRMEYQQEGIVHLLPISHNMLPPASSAATLWTTMCPWLYAPQPLLLDSLGNRFRLSAADTLFRGERFGADGSYYRGGFDSLMRRHGEGFGIDDRLVKYGIWNKDAFRGESMLYTSHRVYGIDISRYQHEMRKPVRQVVKVKNRKGKVTTRVQYSRKVGIDWSSLRITRLGGKAQQHVQGEVDYPVSFVFVKCTQGTSIKSAYYASDLNAALKHGIPVAPYHFFSTRKSGAAQAAYFIKHARLQQATLPPMLDVEPSDAEIRRMGGEEALFREMLKWLQAVEHASGRRPILYVSQSFVDRHMKHAPKSLLAYDVWIARYGEFRPYVKLLFWQLSPYGSVRGIHGDVDINVFNGSRKDFEEWTKGIKSSP